MMFSKIVNSMKNGCALVVGCIFTLIASPIIHMAGLDNDNSPTLEQIEEANRFAEELRKKDEERDVL